jgi:hypothetical protein
MYGKLIRENMRKISWNTWYLFTFILSKQNDQGSNIGWNNNEKNIY